MAIVPLAYREMPFGSHEFVMARPIRNDWSYYDGCMSRQGREEFRPCMIRGHNEGQRVYCIGSQYSYYRDEFEILVEDQTLNTVDRKADELKEGDRIVMRVSSVDRTATGYVMFFQSTGCGGGKQQCVPPETVYTVVEDA